MAQAGVKARLALIVLAFMTLYGCAEPGPISLAQTKPLPPLAVFPGSLLLPVPSARPPLRDSCGAAALAGLVGLPRTQIPVPVDLTHRRVACTACPVAPDVRLDRVNILYDAQTGLVTKITCG